MFTPIHIFDIVRGIGIYSVAYTDSVGTRVQIMEEVASHSQYISVNSVFFSSPISANIKQIK